MGSRSASVLGVLFLLAASQTGGCGGGSSSVSRPPDPNAPPGPFSLLSPADGASELPRKPEFRWSAAEDADDYLLQISTTADFSTGLLEFPPIREVSFVLSSDLAQGGLVYYWRVRARHGRGSTLSSGPARRFSVTRSPGSFRALLPEHGALSLSTTPTFEWTPAADAATYVLELGFGTNFQTFFLRQGGVPSNRYTLTLPLSGSTTYSWRVSAVNPFGISSIDGPVRSFTTAPVSSSLAPFSLVSPAPAFVFPNFELEFFWNGQPSANAYLFQVSDRTDFSRLLLQQRTTQTTYSTPAALFPGVFYWRVFALRESGSNPESLLATAAPWSFSIAEIPPETFYLRSPVIGAVNVPLTPTFQWTSSAGAETYLFELAETQSFAAPVLRQAGLTSTTFTPALTLKEGTRYWWRAVAQNHAGSRYAFIRELDFTTTFSPPPPLP